MKPSRLLFIAGAFLVIAACSSTKKTTTSTPVAAAPASSSTPAPAETSTASPIGPVIRPANGVYPPGNEELTAIQARFKDVTLDKLNEGHILYTKGACVNCHGAKNIYRHDEESWSRIMDNMARRANLTDSQKDAVFKYVLAIKATQPK
ncbi:MAG: hypothetical protein ACXVNO_00865 [Bacteroidia bacterium]